MSDDGVLRGARYPTPYKQLHSVRLIPRSLWIMNARSRFYKLVAPPPLLAAYLKTHMLCMYIVPQQMYGVSDALSPNFGGSDTNLNNAECRLSRHGIPGCPNSQVSLTDFPPQSCLAFRINCGLLFLACLHRRMSLSCGIVLRVGLDRQVSPDCIV